MDADSGLTIAALVHEAHETAEAKGWWDGPQNFPEKLALIHSEVSEVLEEYRKTGLEGHFLYYGDGGKPEGIAAELADVLIRIGDLCQHYGIPLEDAIVRKLEFNRTRPFRHGGKVC